MRWRCREVFRGAAAQLLKGRARFTIPIVLTAISKAYGSLWIHNMSLQDGVLSTPWMNLWGAVEPKWLYIFVAWDTSWYVSLAEGFSFTVDRTFFPGYPILIRLFGAVSGNYWLAAFITSLLLGFASLPVFQAIAEHYMPRAEALGVTLVMAFFPHVFLFTTVAYSESLFLFAVLVCWHFHLKDRPLAKVPFALLATLTRIHGILIVFPMLVDSLIHRRWKDALLTSIPILLVAAVVLPYVNKAILDRFILEFNAATWSVSRVNLGSFWFRDYVAPVFTSARPMSFFHFFHAYALAFIALAGYLAISSSKVDWRLGAYSVLMFITIIAFGYSTGIVRYTSFIFPIWLCIKMKNPVLIVSIMALFYVHSLVLWHQFLWAPYPM